MFEIPTAPPFSPTGSFRVGVDRRIRVLRRRRRLRRSGVALLAVASLGAWPAYLLDRWNRVDRVDITVAGVPDADQVAVPPDAGPGPTTTTGPATFPGQTWLLVGVDSTEDPSIAIDRPATLLTDTIVLARVTGDGELRLLSVPRDLHVPYSSGGEGRINAAYAYGGPVELVATLVDLIGVGIDHLIAIDMDGFARAVDAAGGIEGRFDNDLRSIRSQFAVEGRRCVDLDGVDVLGYVRARSDLQALDPSTGEWITIENDDLARAARQRALMTFVLPEVVDAVRSPLGLTRLADVAADHLTLDNATGIDDLRDLADHLAAQGDVAVEGRVVPGTPAEIEGASVLVPDPATTAAEATWLLTGEVPTVDGPTDDGPTVDGPDGSDGAADPTFSTPPSSVPVTEPEPEAAALTSTIHPC